MSLMCPRIPPPESRPVPGKIHGQPFATYARAQGDSPAPVGLPDQAVGYHDWWERSLELMEQNLAKFLATRCISIIAGK